MKNIIRLFILILLCSIVLLTLFLCIYSHRQISEIIAILIHKPYKIDEIISIYLTPVKFSVIRYSLVIISVVMTFLSFNLLKNIERINLKLELVFSFFSSQLKEFIKGLKSMPMLNKISLLLILVGFASWNMFNLISRPISCDETATYILYSSQSLLFSLARYSANNHPLNSILTSLGNYLPFETKIAIRLPVYFFGLVNIVVIFALVRSVFGNRTAVMATCIYCFAYPVMIYGFQTRGYELVLLFSMIVLFSSIKIILYKQNYYWLIFTAASVLGFYSVLTFLYFYVPIVMFIFLYSIYKRDLVIFKKLVKSGIITLLFSLILYLPFFIFSGISNVFNNDFVKSKPLMEILQLFPSHFMATLNFLFGTGELKLRVDYFSGYSGAIIFLVLFSAFTFAFIKLKKNKNFRFVYFLVLSFIVLSPLLLFVQRVIPYERTWIHLWPIIILSASGIIFLIQRSFGKMYLQIIAVIAGIGYSTAMMYNFNNRYLVFYDRDYQAIRMSNFILKNSTENITIYTNEMLVASTLEYEFICNKKKYKFEYGYLKNSFYNPEADYDFILWDKNYTGHDAPPAKDLLLYSDNFVNIYKGRR